MTDEEIKEYWRTAYCNEKHKKEELEKENAELKDELKKWKDGIALKDEEIGCIETDFNTFKSKAKELLNEFIFLLHNPRTALDTKTVINKAEQFLKENE